MQFFMICCYVVAELCKEHLDVPLFPGELYYVGKVRNVRLCYFFSTGCVSSKKAANICTCISI